MKKTRKILAVLFSAVLITTALSSCGNNKADGDKVTVKVGVVGSTVEDIWKPIKEKVAKEGINLELVKFNDYATPNNALNNGETDLNSFQHRIYLNTEKEQHGYKIEPIANTFITPLSIYSEKIKSVKDLKAGDTIAIPDDVTNGGRAIKVLEAAGIIKIKKDAGFNPTIKDISSYTVPVKIEELKANTIPSALPDVTAAIINGNYALDHGLKADDAIFKDNVLDQEDYWNIIVAKSDDLNNKEKVEAYKKIIKAYQSEETKKVYEETFKGFLIPTGWDQDLLKDK